MGNNLTDRISKTQTYFRGFNIAENVAYITAQLPKGWNIPPTDNDNPVKNSYDQNDRLHYFFIPFNGDESINVLFDAFEAVIKFNKTIEEKAIFFKQKVQELQELVSSETMERLKTLQFTFTDATNLQPKLKSKRKKRVSQDGSTEDNNKPSVLNTEPLPETEVITSTVTTDELKSIKGEDVNDNDLLNEAIELTKD